MRLKHLFRNCNVPGISSWRLGCVHYGRRFATEELVNTNLAFRTKDMPLFYGVVLLGFMIGIWKYPRRFKTPEMFMVVQKNETGRAVRAVSYTPGLGMYLSQTWDDVEFFPTWSDANSEKKAILSRRSTSDQRNDIEIVAVTKDTVSDVKWDINYALHLEKTKDATTT